MVVAAWTVAAMGVFYMLFADSSGLLHAGPMTCIGLTSLGLSVTRNRYEQEQARMPQTAPSGM